MKFNEIDDKIFGEWVKTIENELREDYVKIEQEEQANYIKYNNGHGIPDRRLRKNAQEWAEEQRKINLETRKESAKKDRLAAQFRDIEDFTMEKYAARKEELELKEKQEREAKALVEQTKAEKIAAYEARMKAQFQEQSRDRGIDDISY